MTEQRWAVLIDLDQTLVETSALEELRRRRQWSQVYQSFHLTTLFPGTRRFLQEAQMLVNLSLGIVTSSPRPYAEQLVNHHQCKIPVVVAYHDTRQHKPLPDPILVAAQKLGVPPTRCFHIGDAPKDIIATVQASAIPIGLCWDNSLGSQAASLPKFPLCHNWNEVWRVITATIAAKEG